MDPDHLVEYIERRLAAQEVPIAVYWYAMPEKRDEFTSQFERRRKSGGIQSLIVRERVFDNPNAIMVDVVRLIEAAKAKIVSADSSAGPVDRWAIVLIGKVQLDISNESSPATLPQWFPMLGGQTVDVVIEDISRRVDGSLSIPEMRVTDLSSALFDLEQILVRRLRDIQSANHNTSNQLWDRIRRKDDGKYGEFLERASQALHGIHAKSSYRPSLRDGNSLVARLWSLQRKSSPDELSTAGAALATAASLCDIEDLRAHAYQSFFSVIGRPAMQEEFPQRFGRLILTLVASTCQLVTIAAHADEYPSYPRVLITAVADDLLRSHSSLMRVLLAQDPPKSHEVG